MVNAAHPRLDAGLYLIATPLGAARDITLRALDILGAADLLLAEDTRSLRRLMEIHGIALGDRPLLAYHDHNGARMRPRVLAALSDGKSVAYASEAGTPMVADPGYDLARAVVADGHALISAPGPSAVIAALTVAGLPTDRFLFAGFLPNVRGRRKSALAALAAVPATLIFYESPRRLGAMLADAAAVLGPDRAAAVCRELTKKFEQVRRGSLTQLAETYAHTPPKGEIVVVVDRAHLPDVKEIDLDRALKSALERHTLRDASDRVAENLGVPRRQVYQRALQLDGAKGPDRAEDTKGS